MSIAKWWLSVGLCLMLGNAGLAQVYSWIDENGVRRFSNQAPVIESPQQPDVQIRPEIQHDQEADQKRSETEQNELGALRETWQTESEVAAKAQAEDSEQSVAESGEVVMYTAPGCAYCERARRFLATNNIAFTEKDIKASEAAMSEFKKLGGRGVPLIMVGQNRIFGYNVPALKTALGI